MAKIVTHTDFDGLISAFILREILDIERVVFAEPWMLRDGEFIIDDDDVIVDLPFDARCKLWIDHHESNKEDTVNNPKAVFDHTKKSCPSLIYEYFSGKVSGDKKSFLESNDVKNLIAAADKIDSACFSKEDLMNPDSYSLLSISLKTDNKKKDDEYRLFLLNMLSFRHPEKIIEEKSVKKRIDSKLRDRDLWLSKVKEAAVRMKNSVIIDYTEHSDIGDSPPFMASLLFNEWFIITINKMKYDNSHYKCFVGKNILSKGAQSSEVNIGRLMKSWGGGGHKAAGGCRVPRSDKDSFLKWLVTKLNNSLS